jgi:hypothetical protein
LSTIAAHDLRTYGSSATFVIKQGMVICEPLCDAIGADAFTKVAEEPLTGGY